MKVTQVISRNVSLDKAPSLARRTLRDYVIFVPSLVVPGIINVALVPLLTRLFDPETYGHYVLAIALWNLLPIIFTRWIDDSVLRFASRYHGQSLRFLRLITLLESIISIGVVVGGLFVLSRWPPRSDELAYFYRLVVVGFPAQAIVLALQNYFRAAGRPGIYSLLTTFRVSGGLVIGLLLYYLNPNIQAFLVGVVTSMAILALFTLFLALRNAYISDLETSQITNPDSAKNPFHLSSVLQRLSLYGFPLAGLILAGNILSLGDRYILSYYFDSTVVGIYNAGYTIPEATLRLVSSSLVGAVTPMVFEMWETGDEKGVQRYLGKLIWIFTCVGLPLWIGMIILRHPIRLLINPSDSYAPITNIIPVVALALLLHSYAMLLDLVFLSRTEPLPPFMVTFMGAAINVGLNFVLIPQMGMWGATIATLVSYAGMLIMTILLVCRRLTVPVQFQHTKLLRLSVAIIGLISMSLFVLKLTNALPILAQLMLSAGTGGIFYAALLFKLDDDWRLVVTSMINHVRSTVRMA